MSPHEERLAIQQKIRAYEQNEWFDRDVEDDPPTWPLSRGEVDYTGKKPGTRLATALANKIARSFFDGQIRKRQLIIKDVVGMENYLAVRDRGAILTCNHFNAFDNYAVYKVIQPYLGKRQLYKVIREGNYTSFPGLYGFFFRHCNTLPLASDIHVLREMMDGVQTLLTRGEKILIYPEQAMWWNYRKPRPLKEGAFRFAVKANVPVVPFFITMEDSDVSDPAGFPVQAYTVHITAPLYPDPDKTVRENVACLAEKNYAVWKEIYEDVYGVPLSYRETE